MATGTQTAHKVRDAMSERVYTFDTEIGGRAVRVEYRAPEWGVEPTRMWRRSADRSARFMRVPIPAFEKYMSVCAACEADWRDRVEAQIDEEADRKLEERRDEELA
jgi:hypothetical protein